MIITLFLSVSLSQLAPDVAALDPKVSPQPLTSMLDDLVAKRWREANDRSTAAWRAIRTRDDWERFRGTMLAALRKSLGSFPSPPSKPDLRVTGTVPGDGFRIDNVIYQSRPGLWVTANLYRPELARASMPGIIIVHAHHTPKEHGELQDMGMTWARAGCLVLVPDQLGHGERRQHAFVDAASYPKPFRVSRQDYWFRYDNAIRLHLAGESLIGWMAWDLMRGVDVLLDQKGVDSKRVILLGSVAGGGDPAAVTGALDERIAAVVPFNFGGPQPETRFPLPDDAEAAFNYAGSGSWESTRNLRRSARDGFLPWAIVGSIAPRGLVYAHEFAWDRERDPVWKRLQTIYGWYGAADKLSSTHGRGSVRGQPPESTHCTHIGAVHRVAIHEAFRKWLGIEAREYSQRVPAEKLRCMTPGAERDVKPQSLQMLLPNFADLRSFGTRWVDILGDSVPLQEPAARSIGRTTIGTTTVERILLTTEFGVTVPVMLLLPKSGDPAKAPVVVMVAQAGKADLLRVRAAEISDLLGAGAAVCLPDVRGTGESNLGAGRGRSSRATAVSSSLLMLGEPLVTGQLRDLRSVLAWLRARTDIDSARTGLWGDSLAPVNSPDVNLIIPRDVDAALPKQSEPLGAMLAILGALFERDVSAVYTRGGLESFRLGFHGPVVLIPHDVVVPGALLAGDLDAAIRALGPRPVSLCAQVDGANRRVVNALLSRPFSGPLPRAGVRVWDEPPSAIEWLKSWTGPGQ